jgi:transcriptional regulator
MYLPQTFEETDQTVLHDFIRSHPLATLVTNDTGGLCANHIPMLIESALEGQIVLRGHVARANPLWKNLQAGAEALAIFQDHGLYITPSWYPSKLETGRVVPTWNYVAVHVNGCARAIDEPNWLRQFLTRLTAAHEMRRAQPWRLSDAPEDHIDRQLRAIVGIELGVAHMVGKWKVSQNRSAADAAGVVTGLNQQRDSAASNMAALVASRHPRR